MSQDSQLQQLVLAELNWDPSVTAGHIGVTASAGVVTLTGHVRNYAEKHAAETAARRVKGVKAVAEEIEVRLPFEIKRGDEDIALAAVNRLAWDVTVPLDAVKVKVEKGWVTLTGEVDWQFQKEAAAQDVRGLIGVIGVSNETMIKAKVNTADISSDITQALHRSWSYEADRIKVHADGGTVRLTGSVHTPHDRQVAGQTAWAAPGAISVVNEITVA